MATLQERLAKTLGAQVFSAQELAICGYKYTPSGIYHLDKALGGGVLNGRVTQIWGPEQAGKSTLAAKIVAEDQKANPDHIWIWYDTEFRFNAGRVAAQGVDMSRLYVVSGNFAEETLTQIVRGTRDPDIAGVVIDSLGNLLPDKYGDYVLASAKTAKEKARPTKAPAELARIMSEWCGEISAALHIRQIPFIALNHVRKNIGVTYGSPDTYPGGERYRHIITTSIKVNKGRDIIISDVRVGISSSYAVHKSEHDLFKSDEKTRLVLWFTPEAQANGEVDTVIEEALALGILNQKGASYTSTVESLEIKVFGKAKLVELLKSDENLLAQLNEEIDARHADGRVSNDSDEESEGTGVAD